MESHLAIHYMRKKKCTESWKIIGPVCVKAIFWLRIPRQDDSHSVIYLIDFSLSCSVFWEDACLEYLGS